MRNYNIKPADEKLRPVIQERIDNLNKPKGSLGRLESLAMQICLIQHTLEPKLSHPCHLLFGGDHGICQHGVSASPREVTWQQMINFTKGGGAVNMFCRQHGFRLMLIDVGVDHDLTEYEDIYNRKIAYGTADFFEGPAMTTEQFERAIAVGEEFAEKAYNEGCNVISMGEMGVANTSAASLWMMLLGDFPLKDCIGAGSGLDDKGMDNKENVLSIAFARYLTHSKEEDSIEPILAYFGGFEMVAATGAMLRAAELGMIILVDGFIMTACALAAAMINPDTYDYLVFCHEGDEHGHAMMLRMLNAQPLLRLNMRLGEGTGALCAFPIVDSAVRMMTQMNTFDNAHITKYF